MELVPVVHPDVGTIGFRVGESRTALAIDIEIVMNDVHVQGRRSRSGRSGGRQTNPRKNAV